MPVILKKNHPGPLTDIEADIRSRLRRGAGGSFLYVVPTKRKLRDAQRELLREVPGGAAVSFHLFTLETLSAQLFSLICQPRRIISGPAQSVLVNEAVLSRRDSLRYFRIPASNRLPKGTLQKLVEVINTFKEKGIYLPVLHAELEASEPGEELKLRDILSIYEAYEASLGDKFIDPPGMLMRVNAEWDPAGTPELVRRHFSGVDTIIVSGFDEFSDPELTMLYNLSEPAGTGMLVSFDYHLSNEEIFGHLRENYQKFLQMGFQKVAVPRVRRSTFEDHIRHHLFRRPPQSSPQSSSESPRALNKSAGGLPQRFDCRGKVSLMYVRDREQEVETVAKLIKSLVKEKPGRDLSKICVATYRPQLYAKLFREAFERFGIPANVTDRYSLDQSPFVVALLSLLDVHERNFRLRDIMRALSSPYLAVLSGNAPIDAGNLYEVGTRLKIPAGRTSWDHRIQQRLVAIREELSAAEDDGEEAKLRREESLLRRALKDIETLSALLRRFGSRMTTAQFRDRMVSLLKELRVVECILKVSPDIAGHDQIEKDARAYEKFVSFLDEFLEILALERGETMVEPLSYFVDRLRSAVSDVRYNVRQRYGHGVVVTSFDETRGLRFEVMIMAGLADGEFPPAYQPEIFFSNARRLRDERYHLTEHRYLFYQALTNYEEHLYLTVPRYDGETQIVPSSFVEALLNVVDLDDLRKGLPAEFSERIYSEHDLLYRLGGLYGHAAASGREAVPFLPVIRPGLLECLDHMRHAMEVERSRTNLSALPEYNGRILDHVGPEHRAVLEQLREGVYSVTQLESYGSCPFQYFADRILRLDVMPEIEEGVSPLERGGILHEILFEFYLDRRNRALPPLFACDEAEFRQAVGALREIARRRLTGLDANADPFWELDKEAILGSGNRKGILKELLEMERDSKVGVNPAFFEAIFGSRPRAGEHADPSLQIDSPVTAGRVRLRGKIDRIDVGEKSFRIIDYKTGGKKLPDRGDIDLGISLQLPVYLRVVEQILAAKETGGRTGAAGLYYRLRDPVEQKLGIGSAEHLEEVFLAKKQKQLVGTDEDLRKIVDQAIHFVNEYVDRMSRGEFPVEPKAPEKACPICSFGTVCRIRAIRPKEPGTTS